MIQLGNYAEDATIDFKWHTNDKNGGSVNPTGGTISVYKNNSTTQTTTGVTDSRAFDSIVGVHNCRIDTSDAFYTTNTDFHVVLTGATIDGETVNAVIAQFSIEKEVTDVTRINGGKTNGYNANLKLKSLDCQNPEGSGIIAKAGTEGSSSYPGLYTEGVEDGHGAHFKGGAGSIVGGDGLRLEGVNEGDGLYCDSGSAATAKGAVFNGRANGLFLSAVAGDGFAIRGQGTGKHGITIISDAAGRDINAKELGAVFDIDGVTGAGILEVLKKFADDNGGVDYDAALDSLHEARTANATGQAAILVDTGNIEDKVDIIDANVDTSLVNQASMEGKIDGIQNNTRTVIGLPNRFNIPDTSFAAYKITLNFYDTDGNMEDPDDSEFSIYLEEADATDKTGLLFKEVACTTPLDASSKFAGYKELEKNDTGRYFCFVKVANTETEAQLMYDFACEENSVALHFSRSNLMGSVEIDEVTLEDSNTNKTIVAKALKDQNVSATSAVTGSIYDDLINQIDGIPDAILAKTVEGKTVEEIVTILLSMANGDYDVTIPVVGTERFTFWNQAKTVILWQVDVDATSRTRL